MFKVTSGPIFFAYIKILNSERRDHRLKLSFMNHVKILKSEKDKKLWSDFQSGQKIKQYNCKAIAPK